MNQLRFDGTPPTYIPAVSISRITASHTMGRVPVATMHTPTCVCGIAHRVGYTGTGGNDLAIYRLKIKEYMGNIATVTLPELFVVDEGFFMDYNEWQQKHGNISL